ncbi:aminopeptidase [Fulvitalea axinellae]|uniref:Aminopeptidase n=1 Tax=Fulvitalea axinellae TaxID=1182444 RepID=A0AAU9CPA3_9BACT|nr:aminopeptidase [Fulvitalea axinellae]
MKNHLLTLMAVLMAVICQAQEVDRQFEQLGTTLPTPNAYRTGSGAPGHAYWQQKADYLIKVELDDDKQRIKGSETITYTNHSPDRLDYLWLQLDENIKRPGADSELTSTSRIREKMSARGLERIIGKTSEHGLNIASVRNAQGKDLPFVINKTMMRIDLPKALKPGDKVTFSVDWSYNIIDRIKHGYRGGYEYFPKDGNYLYTISQWFPRMCVYDDLEGWQNKQFLGTGEFALTFGDYEVHINVPADHIVASTGELQNASEVLTPKQLELFEKSKTATEPVIIVSQAEATKKEKKRSKERKTWIYKAENVRDFAFGSSRKYIWDAMGVDIEGKKVMAMSYYPKEANPLYERYSTKTVAHTLRTYSKFTIPYPYPVAISVEASSGMEYPMICFNYGRPESDGTYSESLKYGMISVIIHEVGHNFFPMIINSDERQWAWMDEGLNTFVQYLSEQEWQRDYPSRRGPAYKIVPYMKSNKEDMCPIMTAADNVKQYGNNAYGKPAIGMNILRETVMGRELFDFAFKEYSRRWAFKHPKPQDFFRTMEDASGMDLDWFWNGWFYSVKHVDLSVENVEWFRMDSRTPDEKVAERREAYEKDVNNLSARRNDELGVPTATGQDRSLNDFYNTDYKRFAIKSSDRSRHKSFVRSLSAKEKELYENGLNYYEITFKNNNDGMVMPIILKFEYKDGSDEIVRIPAEIWRRNNRQVTKVFAREKEVASVVLDPFRETADIDENNNYFPRRNLPSRFELYKRRGGKRPNPMQSQGKKSKKSASR